MQEGDVWQPPTGDDDARILRRSALKWAAVFGVLLAAMAWLLWWSSKAVHFTTARIDGKTKATYRIHGVVRDASTGQPVPWAEVFDDPSGHPPFHRSSAGFDGVFELLTIAEPHTVRVAALGYQEARVLVGKRWFLWMPEGEEPLRIELHAENAGPSTQP